MIFKRSQHAIALIVLASLACASEGATLDGYRISYSIVVDRTSEETLAGEPSVVHETTYAHFGWSQSAAGASGRLRVDSVAFSRDGRRVAVGPQSSPVATFIYRVTPDGKVILDSVPTNLVEHPYLATVILELPVMRPVLAADRCRAGATWTDSTLVGPVPIPGADGATAHYRTMFETQAVAGDTARVRAITDVTILGYSGGILIIRGAEHRDATWKYAANCRGPATVTEAGRLRLIYDAQHDTVSVVERRTVASSGS